jgi:hypothetical protein
LFAIGRELYAAMSAGQGKSVLAHILDRLVQYTTVHFAHKEKGTDAFSAVRTCVLQIGRWRKMHLSPFPFFSEHPPLQPL